MPNQPAWADVGIVVWTDVAEDDGLWLQRGDLLWSELCLFRAVEGCETLGDVRAAATEIPWLADWLARHEVVGPGDDTKRDASRGDRTAADDRRIGAELREDFERVRPVPWDGGSRDWLPDDVRALADDEGPRDDPDALTFSQAGQAEVLKALAGAGYELVEDGRPFRELLS